MKDSVIGNKTQWRQELYARLYMLSGRLEYTEPLLIDRDAFVRTLLPDELFKTTEWAPKFQNLTKCLGGWMNKVDVQTEDGKEFWFRSCFLLVPMHEGNFVMEKGNPFEPQILEWYEAAKRTSDEAALVRDVIHAYLNACPSYAAVVHYWPELESFQTEELREISARGAPRLNRKVYKRDVEPHQAKVTKLITKALMLTEIAPDSGVE
jgi:hypothetical protein